MIISNDMINIDTLTIKKTQEHLQKGDFSAYELAEACVEKIQENETEISAYVEVFEDILEQAKIADERIQKGNGAPLTGIPIAIKDNILIKEKISTAASNVLKDHRAVYDAFVVAQLKKDGAIFTGRTNMDEFAMGSSTENSAYGVTKNPHDTSRVPGGSSGGSAAALTYGGCLGSLGSETGGSIRQPAAFCSVVGLKPTYGAVSRFGLIALASSLDQIGPFGKTVEDTEILFNSISGYDSNDSTSAPESLRTKKNSKNSFTIGIPREFLTSEGMDKEVLENFEHHINTLKKAGHTIVDIYLPYMKFALATYYIIMPAEASSNLARFDGTRFGLSRPGDTVREVYENSRGQGFGREARRRIMLGTYVLSSGYYDAYYNKAVALRGKIEDDFREAFSQVDIVMTPTTPTPPFRIGERTKNPVQMYLADIFTVPANIAGIPAISVPSGGVEIDGKRLPLGLHFMAPHFREDWLFSLGKEFERMQVKK